MKLAEFRTVCHSYAKVRIRFGSNINWVYSGPVHSIPEELKEELVDSFFAVDTNQFDIWLRG